MGEIYTPSRRRGNRRLSRHERVCWDVGGPEARPMAKQTRRHILVQPEEILAARGSPAWGRRIWAFNDNRPGLYAPSGHRTPTPPWSTRVYIGTWLLLGVGDTYGVAVVRDDFEIEVVYRGDAEGARSCLKEKFKEHVGGEGPHWKRRRRAPSLAEVEYAA